MKDILIQLIEINKHNIASFMRVYIGITQLDVVVLNISWCISLHVHSSNVAVLCAYSLSTIKYMGSLFHVKVCIWYEICHI